MISIQLYIHIPYIENYNRFISYKIIFQPQYGGPPPEHRPDGPPPLSEAEFEEIMGRNRTVSSSAIARAVSDAAAGLSNY